LRRDLRTRNQRKDLEEMPIFAQQFSHGMRFGKLKWVDEAQAIDDRNRIGKNRGLSFGTKQISAFTD
jgi:hypothetical protein